jgi:hypothetical protein
MGVMRDTVALFLPPKPAPRAAAGEIRLVRPSSGLSESLWVGALALLIIGAMALRFLAVASREPTIQLQAYQRLDTGLSPTEHLVYRTLLASVTDLVDLRAREGQWPEAVLLEEEGISPFADELMPAPADALQWVSYDGGSWVDYLGTDTTGANRVSYILRLIDLHGSYHPHPHPGIDYDPELAVAAQIWIYDEGGRFYPGERLPEAGWTWLLSPADPILSERPSATAGSLQDR